MSLAVNNNTRVGGHIIFRASYVDKNGVKHYAKEHGKKAFPIWVPDKKQNHWHHLLVSLAVTVVLVAQP